MASNNFSLPMFPPFECELDSLDLKQKWKRYIAKFENLTVATGIKKAERKKAMLLHYVGEPVNDILDTLNITNKTYAETKTALDNYFAPSQNKEYQTYLFRKYKQRSSESLEQFNIRLRRAATLYEFENSEREIKSQLIMGCESTKLRRHALQSPNLTLKELLTYGIATETVNKHVELIETENKGEINFARDVNNKFSRQQTYKERDLHAYKQKEYVQNKSMDQICKNCGYQWHKRGLDYCPARGKTCLKCNKKNHFAKVCMTSQRQTGSSQSKQRYFENKPRTLVSNIEEEPLKSDEEFVYTNQMKNENNKPGNIILNINDKPISFMIDSGASVNILNEKELEGIKPKPQIYNTKKLIYPYGQKTHIKMLGQCNLNIEYKQKVYKVNFYISQDKGPSILSKDTSLELNLIKFINSVSQTEQENKYVKYINNNHPELFKGIGKHKTSTIKLHINHDISPVVEKFRRIPFHMRKSVEIEIEKLIQEDIIEEIPEHIATTWVSPIVIIPKKGQPENIRICVDMRAANKAINRARYITPTIDDLMVILNGASYFTKLDLRKGYHQFELDPESREITTFATHKGLYRYKRLSFGINAAAEVFQREISKLINNIPNTINISDDILIFGKSQTQHDEILYKVLNKLSEAGLTLNEEKCIFNKRHLNFYGHIFSNQGMRADPGKVTALANTKIPQTAGEVRSWLGMANFSARYIPNLATISKPLRELTKNKVKWKWESEHQIAFDTINKCLSRYTQLTYFNKARETEIWTDASPQGVGALLVQKQGDQNLIISFASRSLTTTEAKYSQIEREALAIVWAVEHFHIYLYGKTFTVVTDHKPLIPLLNNPRSKLSARLERWTLKLQRYNYKIEYKKGKDNPADYLSRYPNVKESTVKHTKRAEEYINFLSNHLAPKDISLEEIREQTKNDALLQQVIQKLKNNKWHEKPQKGVETEDINKFYKIRNELTTNDDQSLLLRCHRAVMPLALQDRAIEIAHNGHQGITNTKKLIREKTWFININKKIEEKIKHCAECNAVTKDNHRMPLQPSKLPNKPWEYLHVDHKGPLPNGKYLLVMIDLYTRFPIVEIVNSTTASTNINKMEKVFALLGMPVTICTDNGSPFNSYEFAEFTKKYNIKHRKITPLWPQANGEVERFNRTLSKTLRIAFTYKLNYEVELTKFLRNYRVTPHNSTKLPPAELLFNRTIDSGIPTINELPKSETINKEKIKINDNKAKEKAKQYYDNKYQINKNMPEVGNQILIKNPKPNKMDTPYDPKPFVITNIKGPQVTAKRKGQTITRHITDIKVIPENTMSPEPKQIEKLAEEKHNLRKYIKQPKKLIEEV